MRKQPVSGVVTTLNNAGTLENCLASLAFCDEIVVLDSGSTDATCAIATRHGARWFVEPFKGYSAQKQSAIDKARHDWILLLDADESLTDPAQAAIETELRAPRAQGYRLPRQEWLFWRWTHPGTRPNWQLRLFRKSRGGMNAVPVHAAPEVAGKVLDLDAPFRHFGEPQLAVRVDKINRYSSGLVDYKLEQSRRWLRARLLLYPGFMFLRFYLGKRYFLNGWAGYFAARTQAFYAFLKYAKVFEALQAQRSRTGDAAGAASASPRRNDPGR